jgi:hypothetical protein
MAGRRSLSSSFRFISQLFFSAREKLRFNLNCRFEKFCPSGKVAALGITSIRQFKRVGIKARVYSIGF